MEILDDFAVEELPPEHRLSEHHAMLTRDGLSTGVIVNGSSLSHQFAYQRHYAIMTHYDFFDGVDHWISLLNPELEVIDLVSLPQSFGFVKDLEIAENERLSFRLFDSNDRWSVSIDIRGRSSFALRHLVRRRNRFLFSKRHLWLQLESADG